MNIPPILQYQSIFRAISERTRWKSSFVADLSVFAGLLAILYILFVSGRIWFAPFTPVAHISSSPRALAPVCGVFPGANRDCLPFVAPVCPGLRNGGGQIRTRGENHAAAARYPAVDSGAEFSSRRHAGDGRAVSGSATGPGAGFDPADFHGASVEYRVQLLRFVERNSSRAT